MQGGNAAAFLNIAHSPEDMIQGGRALVTGSFNHRISVKLSRKEVNLRPVLSKERQRYVKNKSQGQFLYIKAEGSSG